TNFLWTLLAAGAIWAGLHPAGVALAANIASSVCLVGLTYFVGNRGQGSGIRDQDGVQVLAPAPWPLTPFLAAVLLAVDPTLVTYGARGGGLEAVPFALLVLLSFALLWTAEPSAMWRGVGGLALALAALTRPEGLLVALLFFALRAFQ